MAIAVDVSPDDPRGLPAHIRIPRDSLIGRGKQGAVYRLDATRCIKVARDREALRAEIAAMRRGQVCPRFPRLHEWGEDYMVREYIPGQSLGHHLNRHPLSRDLARQLIDILKWLRRLGFSRIDMRLAHIIYDGKNLYVIDPANLNRKHDRFPRKVWRGLRKRGAATAFRSYLAEMDPRLYDEWRAKMT